MLYVICGPIESLCQSTKDSVKWAMRKKQIPEVLVRSVMSLYEGTNTGGRVQSELSEECEVKFGMHQGPVLSTFLFAVVGDVVTEFARGVRQVNCCMLMT